MDLGNPQFFQVFDEVISAVEEKPNDVQAAIDRLKAVGKMHRTKVIFYFLFFISKKVRKQII